MKAFAALMAIVAVITISSCNTNSGNKLISQSTIDSLRNQIMELTKSDATISLKPGKFDTLDFTVYSGQQWQRLNESYDKNIKVVMPDVTHLL